ncbi:hypothetical protein ABZ816_12680 [Actinosynnema sp. NPDC047251]|uniref:hypothetical protein n=1 Tax=Saccharothrix espanaensis TaxID=103731 RepID=UPI0002EF31B6|nr:hypothetical protein [Saccharothrix espanaensis]
MKALKAVVVVAVSGSLLVGCGNKDWEGDVAFKVTKVNPGYESMGQIRPPYANLEIDQDEPKSIEPISTRVADLDQLPEGVAAGDLVTCEVRQTDESGFDQKGVRTDVGSCKSR